MSTSPKNSRFKVYAYFPPDQPIDLSGEIRKHLVFDQTFEFDHTPPRYFSEDYIGCEIEPIGDWRKERPNYLELVRLLASISPSFFVVMENNISSLEKPPGKNPVLYYYQSPRQLFNSLYNLKTDGYLQHEVQRLFSVICRASNFYFYYYNNQNVLFIHQDYREEFELSAFGNNLKELVQEFSDVYFKLDLLKGKETLKGMTLKLDLEKEAPVAKKPRKKPKKERKKKSLTAEMVIVETPIHSTTLPIPVEKMASTEERPPDEFFLKKSKTAKTGKMKITGQIEKSAKTGQTGKIKIPVAPVNPKTMAQWIDLSKMEAKLPTPEEAQKEAAIKESTPLAVTEKNILVKAFPQGENSAESEITTVEINLEEGNEETEEKNG